MAQNCFPSLSEDRLLDGKIRLLQPVDGFRAAIDPVFLAASVPSQATNVLDVGCGSGAASLCLAQRLPACRVIGLDIQQDMIALCARNAALNGMEDRVSALVGDIAAPPFPASGKLFDCIITNPPFLPAERGNVPPDAARARAHVEQEADLPLWLNSCLALLRPKGALCLVHRADRLGEIMSILSGVLGEICLFPLWPKQGKAAKRILVRGRKGIATPDTVCAGITLHNQDGSYTLEADAILRAGQGLVF